MTLDATLTTETAIPAVSAARKARRCYVCTGTGEITVSTWSDATDGYIDVPSICVRCKGAGELVDGPLSRDIPEFHELRTPPCICDFSIDGPEGNPRCQGR